VSRTSRNTRLPAIFSALESRGGLRRVLLAFAVTDVVGMGVWLGIILWAFAAGGASLAGLVAAAQSIPAALFSPVLAGIGDGLARGTALVLGYLALAATTTLTAVTLAVNAPIWVTVCGSALVTLAVSVARPFHFAALPQLSSRPQELASANALSSVIDGAALFVGPLLAGLAVQVAGPWLIFVVSTVLCIVGAVMCMGLGLSAHLDSRSDALDASWRSAFQGIGAMLREWAALVLLLVMALRFVVAGAMDVMGVAYSNDALAAGDSGAGVLLGALGIGQLVGGFVAASFAVRRRLSPVVLGGCVLMGHFVSALALLPTLVLAAASLVVAGIGMSVLLVAGRTLLQRSADDGTLARVFAVQEATGLLGLALGSLAAPVLISWLSPAGAFVPLGIGTALIAVAAHPMVRRLDTRAMWLPEELALLRGIPFLAVLPPYELERLAGRSAWLDTKAAESIVREGEPGDAFYIIAHGDFEVWISGLGGVRVLGPGDGFGEIALLHSVPRTATVTSLTSGRLLTIAGHDFLAAVTGSVDGQAIASEVEASYLLRRDDEALG
jgi:MFS family permease